MSTTETTWELPPAAGGRRPPRRLLLGMMVAVFFSGGVIGSGATLMIINRQENSKRHDPMIVGHQVAAELEQELSLSQEQTAQVDRIMKDHLAAMGRLRRDVFVPAIRDAFEEMKSGVAAVLDDEQRVKWNAWLEERRKRVCPPGGHGRSGHSHGKPGANSTQRHPSSGPTDAAPTPDSESKPATADKKS